MMNKPKIPEVKVYAVGVTNKGNSAVFALVNGAKWEIPTDNITMARLAEKGVPVIYAR